MDSEAQLAKKLARKLRRKEAAKKVVQSATGKAASAGAVKRGKQLLRVARANPVTGIRGHGNYFTSPGAGGTSLINKGLNAAGTGLATALGFPQYAGLAGSAGSWLSRVMGFGAYRISKNTTCAQGFSNMSPGGGANNIPEFGSTASRGSIRVRHREFVKDILSSSTFNLENWLIHVGNPTLWPWLATIAQNFEEAQIHGAMLEFKPTSAYAVAGTQAMGNVIMATDYDVVDANYANKREMEIVEFSSSAMSNVVQIHPIECDPKQSVLAEHYIQYGATTVADFPDDPRFGCLGNFQIAASGMPTNGQAVGELWVTYDVELRKPQLPSSTIGVKEYHLSLSWPALATPTAVQTWGGYTTAPFTWQPYIGTAVTSGALLTCVVPGSYILSMSVRSGTTMPGYPTNPITIGPGVVTTPNMFSTDGGVRETYAVSVGDSVNTYVFVSNVTFTEAGQTVAISMPLADAPTVTHADLVITTFNPVTGARKRATTSLDKQLELRDKQLFAQAARLRRLEDLCGKMEASEVLCSAAAHATTRDDSSCSSREAWAVSPVDEEYIKAIRRADTIGAVSPALRGGLSGSNKK